MVEAAELLDIDSATVDQLKTPLVIGNAYPEKLIPQGTYDKIKEQVVQKQKDPPSARGHA